jgi:hypothetical protein
MEPAMTTADANVLTTNVFHPRSGFDPAIGYLLKPLGNESILVS